MPRLFQPPLTVTPGSFFLTRNTLGPGPPAEPQLATMPSATPALVTQLFSALRVTAPFCATALETGAQNWLRLPFSENARVLRCRPAATSRSTASNLAGSARQQFAPQWCI